MLIRFFNIASLHAKPIIRPQAAQKSQARRAFPTSKSPDKISDAQNPPPTAAPAPTTTTSIEQWVSLEDQYDEDAAAYNERQEEKKKRSRYFGKKSKKKKTARIVDFDKIYDPMSPTQLADYKGSEEQVKAESDWKERLYAHKLRGGKSKASREESEEKDSRPKGQLLPFAFGQQPILT